MCGGKVGKVLGDANPLKVAKDPIGALKDTVKNTESINLGHRVNESLGVGDKFTDVLYGNADAAKKKAAAAQAEVDAQTAAEQAAQDAASAAAGQTSLAQRRKTRTSSLLSGALGGNTSTLGGM